jgi:chorismate mutase
MSPININKLNLLRKKLDKLDYDLLKIIKKRSEIIKKVILLKTSKTEIVDKKRINQILKKIKNESVKLKIDPMITNRIWKNMIWSYINFERRNFKKK